MQEKHSSKTVKFDMKTVASYQQDPLARQCAEAIYIKSINLEKRINNKTEYHQPGEIKIRYEKNDNTKIKVNGNENKDQEKTQNIDENVRQNPQNDKEQHQKNNQKTIKEFFKMMENTMNINNANEESTISSQDMIADARARRSNNQKDFNCEQCEYKTKSKTLLHRHVESDHKNKEDKISSKMITERIIRKRNKCDECEYKFTSENNLKKHMETAHKNTCNQRGNTKETKTQINSKRIKCNLCDKKFNKQETYNIHITKTHK